MPRSGNNDRLYIALSVSIFGSIFLTVGLLVAIAFGTLNTLDCRRTVPGTSQGYCYLSHQGILGGDRTQEFSLSSLESARVATSYDTDGDTHRVVLTTTMGEQPFTDYWSSGLTDKQATVDQIQGFLANTSRPELTIRQDDRGFGYLFLGLFGGIGVVSIAIALAVALKWFG